MPGLLVDRFLKHFSNFFKPASGATNAIQTPMDEGENIAFTPGDSVQEDNPGRAQVDSYPKEKD